VNESINKDELKYRFWCCSGPQIGKTSHSTDSSESVRRNPHCSKENWYLESGETMFTISLGGVNFDDIWIRDFGGSGQKRIRTKERKQWHNKQWGRTAPKGSRGVRL